MKYVKWYAGYVGQFYLSIAKMFAILILKGINKALALVLIA